ncbi:hypothetical protein G6F65_022035 [Rhizopus arrhizus]|nr:hypothetical protein G6F65_022035 [Rhizopus arrhizus]
MAEVRSHHRSLHPSTALRSCLDRPASSAAAGQGAWPAPPACRHHPSRAGRTTGRCPARGCGWPCRHDAGRPRRAVASPPAVVGGYGCHRRGSARTDAAAAQGRRAAARTGPRSAARWDGRRIRWRGNQPAAGPGYAPLPVAAVAPKRLRRMHARAHRPAARRRKRLR